ncbi:hypothetical protein [Streptomyces decoyicus]
MSPRRTTTSLPAPLPVLRAAVFAVVSSVLGIWAHHLVDEGPVTWRKSAVAAVLLFALGLAGTRRPRSLGRVIAAHSVCQGALHAYLSAGTAPMSPMSGMGHHHTVMADADGAWHERLHHHAWAMTLAHAAAAVLVAVLMHRADAVCWSLARGVVVALQPVRVRIATACALLRDRRLAALPQHFARYPVRDHPPPGGAVLAYAVVRRGPPAQGPVLST